MKRSSILLAALFSCGALAQGIGIVFGPGPGMTPGTGGGAGSYPASRSRADAGLQGFYPPTIVSKYGLTCAPAWVKQVGNDDAFTGRRNDILDASAFGGQYSDALVHLHYHDDNSTGPALVTCVDAPVCPYGGVLSGDLLSCDSAPACPVGQTRNFEGECVPV